tara:strand:+ start:44 stop:172 length:129 start_codon:yes stop_codon:yes gene_type:complete
MRGVRSHTQKKDIYMVKTHPKESEKAALQMDSSEGSKETARQ